MKITLIACGRIKEKFYKDAVAEYAKRLSAYCTLNIIEVTDEKNKENMTAAETAQLLDKEAERIVAKIPEGAYVCALAIEGVARDSEGMARWLRDLTLHGVSHIAFIIGGSVGLSERVLQMSKEKISFSKLTFPHQLMRVIFLEQLYRWYKIERGEPYHK
ncbi:MAG: 23S rRNA (pseudouridine(1915)-N(3))-methyltransferase RlmH [Clostridiales bacterium]|nr:23S rRNA (pseudouridine(1915)-N(3))-methyltransferase RlmH [Clostridiales bacterium]